MRQAWRRCKPAGMIERNPLIHGRFRSDLTTRIMSRADSPQGITRLLARWQNGDAAALDEIMPLLSDELQRVAARHMRKEKAGHTLQSTALINEAYMRLVEVDLPFRDRAHFLAIASKVMRRILVDHARGRQRGKRGAGKRAHSFDEAIDVGEASDPRLVDLDDALNKLAVFDARLSSVVELIYFGGLTTAEAAEALGVSRVTLNKDMQLARAWLARELQ
jgi:RNA polymerase sigma-70 factor, ECF subfamily